MFYISVGVLMLFMLIIEATLLSVLFPMITPMGSFAVPNLVIVILVFAVMVREDQKMLIVAFIIGLIQDIVFGSYIGLYAFTYAFIAYFTNMTFRLFIERQLMIFLLTVVLALFSFDVLIWAINSLFGLVSVTLGNAFDRYFWGRLLLGSAIGVISFRPVMAILRNRGAVDYE